MRRVEVEAEIDALLPQTQCTRCGYPGCLPYAEAVSAGAAPINQCPPGGTALIGRLAALLRCAPLPLDPATARRRRRASPGSIRRLHRLRALPAALPRRCDPRCTAPAAHGHRHLVHGLRTVRAGLPGRLHPHAAVAAGRVRRRPPKPTASRYRAHEDAARARCRGARARAGRAQAERHDPRTVRRDSHGLPHASTRRCGTPIRSRAVNCSMDRHTSCWSP